MQIGKKLSSLLHGGHAMNAFRTSVAHVRGGTTRRLRFCAGWRGASRPKTIGVWWLMGVMWWDETRWPERRMASWYNSTLRACLSAWPDLLSRELRELRGGWASERRQPLGTNWYYATTG